MGALSITSVYCVVVLVANRISAVVCLEIVAGIDVLKVR